MAASIITQVDRDGSYTSAAPAPPGGQVTGYDGERRDGFFGKLCNCFRSLEIDRNGKNLDSSSGSPRALLPPIDAENFGRKCLVLDLDETLVHSSFKPVPRADYIIPVEIENQIHNVYVLKRPGADHFLKTVAQQFEVVVFTASLAKYADPLLDLLDPNHYIRFRLFREACVQYEGNYVKDLARLGRDLKHTMIVDNSPGSYILQPQNAIPISSWFDDMSDTELFELLPLLDALAKVDNVQTVLDKSSNH